jgi:hypothetical protein
MTCRDRLCGRPVDDQPILAIDIAPAYKQPVPMGHGLSMIYTSIPYCYALKIAIVLTLLELSKSCYEVRRFLLLGELKWE